MDKTLGFKLVAIAVLVGLLLIGLNSIDNLVTERQTRRNEVVLDIARSSSGSQQLTGPVLVIPFEQILTESIEDPSTHQTSTRRREINGHLHLLPESFTLDATVTTERRARGIYEARLYHAALRMGAKFDIPPHYGLAGDLTSYRFGQPSLSFGINDVRGIDSVSNLLLNGQPVKLLPGSESRVLGAGVHVPVPALNADGQSHLNLSLELALQGTNALQITPVGRDSRVSLTSNWPHPNFTGQYLPNQHEISEHGFSARWTTSIFSTNLEESLASCAERAACEDFAARHFGVSLVDPVDQYLKTDRAIKYALLFILLTFAGFFLFEVLERLAIHAVQYGFVGAALAVFYLLLLSFSEHIGFALAYVVSSAACVALIGFYLSAILRSALRGTAFACTLAVLYGLLYGILSADDYALLMGSLLLFGLLAGVMMLTRRVDWFELRGKEAD